MDLQTWLFFFCGVLPDCGVAGPGAVLSMSPWSVVRCGKTGATILGLQLGLVLILLIAGRAGCCRWRPRWRSASSRCWALVT